MSIPVNPSQVNQFITSVQINIYEVILNVGLNCMVYAYNSDGKQVDSFGVAIVGDEYNNWSNDDELQLLILSKCGLSPLVSVDVPITD